MNYSNITNTLVSTLANSARVCTRYNHPAETEQQPNGIQHICRDAKAVVVDNNETDVSFTMRVLQFAAINGNALNPTYILEMMREGACGNEHIKVFSSIHEALDYSGLDQKYANHFANIMLDACDNGALGDIVITGMKSEQITGIALLIQDTESTLVIQLTE